MELVDVKAYLHSRLGFICALIIQLTFWECIKRKPRARIPARLDVLTEQNRTEKNMLYNMCHVMLYNMCNVMLYYMCHVMLCYITYVI